MGFFNKLKGALGVAPKGDGGASLAITTDWLEYLFSFSEYPASPIDKGNVTAAVELIEETGYHAARWSQLDHDTRSLWIATIIEEAKKGGISPQSKEFLLGVFHAIDQHFSVEGESVHIARSHAYADTFYTYFGMPIVYPYDLKD